VLCVPWDKYNPIKTIGFTTRYRDKDKNAINTILDFAKLINASVKCLYVKTSDSDVSSETMEDWKMTLSENLNLLYSKAKKVMCGFRFHSE
jgi:ABC-type xylose transport system substrate-binding protein